MPKHNNVIPNQHFRKEWMDKVRTWFDQPARKVRRRQARLEKARRVFPRPVEGRLRPVVHPPTQRYNAKLRLGRGFTLEELKAAGVSRHQAGSIGIAVDHRRHNKSQRSFTTNVQRLKEYKSKLILFPRKAAKPKKGDSSKEELAKAAQLTGPLLPIRRTAKHILESVNIKDIDLTKRAYGTLRQARSDVRLVGVRAKAKKLKAEAAAQEAQKAMK